MGKFLLNIFAILAVSSVIDSAPTNTVVEFKDLIKSNTPENIAKLQNLGKDDLAELYGGQYQGDIILEPGEERELEGKKGKTGLIATRYRWAGGIIPYHIDEFDFNAEQIDYIRLGMHKMEEVTCLKFVPYDPRVHNDFVRITGRDSGCYSYVGRRGTGEQQLNLQTAGNQGLETGCFRLYTIVHEFLHAVGFYHMQSATERDQYVQIVTENIQAGTANNFNKYEADVITNYGVEYDYGSCMHYPATAFSTNGQPTIVNLRPLNGEVMGQRVRMSERDILRVNRSYCPGIGINTDTPPTTTRSSSITDSINNWVNNLVNNILGGWRP